MTNQKGSIKLILFLIVTLVLLGAAAYGLRTGMIKPGENPSTVSTPIVKETATTPQALPATPEQVSEVKSTGDLDKLNSDLDSVDFNEIDKGLNENTQDLNSF